MSIRNNAVDYTKATISLGAIVAPAALLIAGVASAAPVSRAIPYEDLDLASEGGRTALESRIEATIDSVCAKPIRRSGHQSHSAITCRSVARAQADTQVAALDGEPIKLVFYRSGGGSI